MKTLKLNNEQVRVLIEVLQQLKGTQLRLEEPVINGAQVNKFKSLKGNTRVFIKAVAEKFGTQWVSFTDPKFKKLAFSHQCTQLGNLFETLKTRGMVKIEYKNSLTGKKVFVDRFQMVELV